MRMYTVHNSFASMTKSTYHILNQVLRCDFGDLCHCDRCPFSIASVAAAAAACKKQNFSGSVAGQFGDRSTTLKLAIYANITGMPL